MYHIYLQDGYAQDKDFGHTYCGLHLATRDIDADDTVSVDDVLNDTGMEVCPACIAASARQLLSRVNTGSSAYEFELGKGGDKASQFLLTAMTLAGQTYKQDVLDLFHPGYGARGERTGRVLSAELLVNGMPVPALEALDSLLARMITDVDAAVLDRAKQLVAEARLAEIEEAFDAVRSSLYSADYLLERLLKEAQQD